MCGRYFIDPDNSEINEMIDTIHRNDPSEQVKSGEIFPTNPAPIFFDRDGTIVPRAAIWGFPKFDGKGVVINARSETAPEKRMFRESLLRRRCIIPATGFYEWDRSKQKYLFRLQNAAALYLAGIYNDFRGERRFTILTSAANDTIADVHDRMPVILPDKDKVNWVQDTDFALRYLTAKLPDLVREKQ